MKVFISHAKKKKCSQIYRFYVPSASHVLQRSSTPPRDFSTSAAVIPKSPAVTTYKGFLSNSAIASAVKVLPVNYGTANDSAFLVSKYTTSRATNIH